MRLFFTTLLVLVLASGAMAKTRILKGSIGKIPVFVKLEDYDDGAVESRYFYQSSLKDIVLRGKKTGGLYVLYVNGDEQSFDEKWALRESGSRVTGEWRSKKGKVLPVQLEPVAAGAVQNPYAGNAYIAGLQKTEPFDYIRSAFLKLKQDSTSRYSGKGFVWYSETHCNAPFLRLGEGFAADARQAVNPALEGIHFEKILSQLGCASGFSYSKGEGIFYDTELSYLTPDLLGFKLHSYTDDCGGAHPDGGSTGYLIDLHSGKRYELDDVIAFHSSATTEARSGFDAFSKYRSTHFAPALLKLETAAYEFKEPKNDDDDCNFLDVDLWDYPSWSFTERGIEFTPIFPRVARNCEEPFELPFSVLAAYKNPRFPYTLAAPKK